MALQAGWLFLPPEDVPERWRGRGTLVYAVPLLPEESRSLLDEGSAAPAVSPEEERLMQMYASGAKVEEIARELRVSSRSITRRLTALRERLGLRSNIELTAFLARQGFSDG